VELALEGLLDGERLVDGGILGLEANGGVGGVGEEGGVVWGVGEVVVEVKVGLVVGLAEVAVDEVAEEDLLDFGGNDGGDEEEA
jgi:hypothetical protein